MSDFATTIDRARAEFVANPRLRLGVWIIVAILAGYFALVVQADRVETESAEFASADDRLTRGRDLLARQDWAERLDAARITETDLRGRLWQAPNEGLAQASLRTAVDELTAKLYLSRPRIELGLSRPVPDAVGLWQVQARIVGQAVGPGALRLLYRIASHPSKLVVERLDLTRERASMRIELLLSAYFLLGDADNPASASE